MHNIYQLNIVYFSRGILQLERNVFETRNNIEKHRVTTFAVPPYTLKYCLMPLDHLVVFWPLGQNLAQPRSHGLSSSLPFSCSRSLGKEEESGNEAEYCTFCFSISDHGRDALMGIFLSYAYICTCIRRHLKETIPSSNITCSEMGQQNIQAKEVYR